MIPLYDTARSRRLAVVNWILILLNGLVFYYELRLGNAGLEQFIRTWGLNAPALIAHPEAAWPTIFTSMFIHGGWFHILSNMWVLFIFGDNVEDRLGHVRYLFFYLLSGVAAALLQAALLSRSSMPMVGASGAIAGVLGAYMVLFPRARVASLVPILFIFTIVELPAVVFLAFWFVSQLFSGLFALNGGASSGIAWWAHVGGFVFGMAAGLVLAPRRRYYSQI
jgi:membrane associated rhomboid family serine protease